MRANKALGQHFLMHAQIAQRMVHEARIDENDTVLEIGPGTGMLTRALIEKARHVIAIETDHALAQMLRETFADAIRENKLVLIEQDVREFDPSIISGSYKLVANIPYYLTGDIVRRFLESNHRPTSMTVLVQKEVAERIAREKKGSLLSMAVRVYGRPRYCFTVPKGAFIPPPNVDSAVLSIEDLSSPFENETQARCFFTVLKAGFAHRRKFLANNLTTVASAAAITAAFVDLSIEAKARAEDLPPLIWQKLAKALIPES